MRDLDFLFADTRSVFLSIGTGFIPFIDYRQHWIAEHKRALTAADESTSAVAEHAAADESNDITNFGWVIQDTISIPGCPCSLNNYTYT